MAKGEWEVSKYLSMEDICETHAASGGRGENSVDEGLYAEPRREDVYHCDEGSFLNFDPSLIGDYFDLSHAGNCGAFFNDRGFISSALYENDGDSEYPSSQYFLEDYGDDLYARILEHQEDKENNFSPDLTDLISGRSPRAIHSSFPESVYLNRINRANAEDGDEDFAEENYAANENAYKPRKVRGKGMDREGMCGLCEKWYKLKTSNYWYHMNFTHGITSTGGSYPTPKTVASKAGISAVCPRCRKMIRLGGGKRKENKLFNWYKHYQRGCK